MADQSGGYPDQPVPHGGNHGLAVADAVPEQPAAASGLGKKYLDWTGRQGRATVISPMTRTRKVVFAMRPRAVQLRQGVLRLAVWAPRGAV